MIEKRAFWMAGVVNTNTTKNKFTKGEFENVLDIFRSVLILQRIPAIFYSGFKVSLHFIPYGIHNLYSRIIVTGSILRDIMKQ